MQDVDSFVSKLLNRLARDIIVRESRYTWPYEQKTRLEKVTQAYTSQRPETIADFLEFYNNEI